MERILTSEIHKQLGKRVKVAGWIHRVRLLGGINFLILRDRAGLLQIVIEEENELSKLRGLQVESVIEVEGEVVAEPRAPQGVEMRNPKITVLSPVTDVLPFEINKRELNTDLNNFLNNAPILLRHTKKQATFRLFAGLITAFAEHLTSQGFIQIKTPKIISSATEGGADIFPVNYFGRKAYLAQSPQLYKQIMVGVFERVFEIGHAYRAEPHSTSRHLNEYVSLDFEMGFIKDYTDVMAAVTSTVRHMIDRVQNTHAKELETLKVKLPTVEQIPAIKFRQAQELIKDRFGEDCRQELDLSPQHERWLCQYALEEHGCEFIYVTHYPRRKRPFYTMPDEDDPEHTKSFDLLFRGLEIVTGSQRIHSYQQLVDNIREFGLNPKDFEGYLQAFKYGMPPEGGSAMGAERLVSLLIGAENIRETALFPRDVNRLTP